MILKKIKTLFSELDKALDVVRNECFFLFLLSDALCVVVADTKIYLECLSVLKYILYTRRYNFSRRPMLRLRIDISFCFCVDPYLHHGTYIRW